MGTLINTGINYRVREGDSLFSIATRFFSSVPHILSVNPDIDKDSANSELLLGDRLCVIPPLCRSVLLESYFSFVNSEYLLRARVTRLRAGSATRLGACFSHACLQHVLTGSRTNHSLKGKVD